jgi:hypothetical protein
MAARGADLACDINTMLVVLQAVIDECDAAMTDPDVRSAKSTSDGRKFGAVLTRPAISGVSSRAMPAGAMAVAEYRSRRSDDQIEPQHG